MERERGSMWAFRRHRCAPLPYTLRSALAPGLCAVALIAASHARADTEPPAKKVNPDDARKSVWSIGASGIRHTLKAGDGNHVIGASSAVSLGRGYIAANWYVNVALDIIAGPYQSPQQQKITLDFSGTGLTAFWGYSAEAQNLRSDEGSYGFALGLNYSDIVGRAVGERRTISQEPGQSDQIIDRFVMRMTNFSLIPAVFFSWLKEARPKGNDPSLLTTRLEGYFLTIGIEMPLLANYTLSYVRQATDSGGARGPETPVRTKGRLKGYSLLVTFTALLGV